MTVVYGKNLALTVVYVPDPLDSGWSGTYGLIIFITMYKLAGLPVVVG